MSIQHTLSFVLLTLITVSTRVNTSTASNTTYCSNKDDGAGFALRFTANTDGYTGPRLETPVIGTNGEVISGFTIALWVRRICPASIAPTTDGSCGYPGNIWSIRDTTIGLEQLFTAGDFDDGYVALEFNTIQETGVWLLEDEWTLQVFSINITDMHVTMGKDYGVPGRSESAVLFDSNNIQDPALEQHFQLAASNFKKTYPSDNMTPFSVVIGDGGTVDNLLVAEIDNVCIWTRFLGPEDLAILGQKGCSALPGLRIEFDFDNDVASNTAGTIPSVFGPTIRNRVSGQLEGVMRPFYSATNTNNSSLEAEELVYGMRIGVFDFETPFHVRSTAPTSGILASREPQFVMLVDMDSNRVTHNIVMGTCPSQQSPIQGEWNDALLLSGAIQNVYVQTESKYGSLNVVNVNDTMQQLSTFPTTTSAKLVLDSSKQLNVLPITFEVTDLLEWEKADNGTVVEVIRVWLQDEQLGNIEGRVSFRVAVVKQTRPEVAWNGVEVEPKTNVLATLPGSAWAYIHPYGEVFENIALTIHRLEVSPVSSLMNDDNEYANTTQGIFGVYICEDNCLYYDEYEEVNMVNETTDGLRRVNANDDPVVLTTTRKQILVTHTIQERSIPSPNSKQYLRVVYTMGNSAEAVFEVAIVLGNRPPIVETVPDAFVVREDSKMNKIDLSLLVSDYESDSMFVWVSKFPEHGSIFNQVPDYELHTQQHQHTESDTQGNTVASEQQQTTTQIVMISDTQQSGTINQWVSSSLSTCQPNITSTHVECETTQARASTCWNSIWCLQGLSGPPDVYPLALDLVGTWQIGLGAIPLQYIEVSFDNLVYATQLTMFENWHPGGATKILARNPASGDWETVWFGPSMFDRWCPDILVQCAEAVSYTLCPKPFPTQWIRVEFANAPIERFISVDAIRLSGTMRPYGGIVRSPSKTVFYSPDPHYSGTDEFEITVSDCRFELKTQFGFNGNYPASMKTVIPLNITQESDSVQVPSWLQHTWTSVIIPGSDEAPIHSDDTDSGIGSQPHTDIQLSPLFLQVDIGHDVWLELAEEVPATIEIWVPEDDQKLRLLNFGERIRAIVPETQIDKHILDQVPKNTEMKQMHVIVRTLLCQSIASQTLGIRFKLINGNGGETIEQDLRIILDCAELPLELHRVVISPTILHVNSVLIVVGVVMIVCFMMFNIVKRSHIVVRLSSWRINLIILFGALTGVLNISLLVTTSVNLSECKSLDAILPVAVENITTSMVFQEIDTLSSACSSVAGVHLCLRPLMAYGTSWILIFSSVFGKLTKLNKVFNQKSLSVVRYSDKTILSGVLLQLILFWALLVGLFATNRFKLGFHFGALELNVETQRKRVQVLESCQNMSYADVLFSIIIPASTLYGCYLAYRVRALNLKTNEAGLVGLCMYNVTFICLPNLFVASVLLQDDQYNAKASYTAIVVWFTLVSIPTIFTVPRMLLVLANDTEVFNDTSRTKGGATANTNASEKQSRGFVIQKTSSNNFRNSSRKIAQVQPAVKPE